MKKFTLSLILLLVLSLSATAQRKKKSLEARIDSFNTECMAKDSLIRVRDGRISSLEKANAGLESNLANERNKNEKKRKELEVLKELVKELYSEKALLTIKIDTLEGKLKAMSDVIASLNDNAPHAPSDVEAVDLGLPSGTLWASMNVGATRPEEYGDYFAWGETKGYNSGKTSFSKSTYRWSDGSSGNMTKYCTMDRKTELEPEDDAACANWGTDWRTPSMEQIKELEDECSWTSTTMNGIKGFRIRGYNGKYIFLPAAGVRYDNSNVSASKICNYWSRTLFPEDTDLANGLEHYLNAEQGGNFNMRESGLSIRPVRAAQK